MEDDFTFNIVFHPDDLILFRKKIRQTLFYKLKLKLTQKKKKKTHFEQRTTMRKVQFKKRCCKLIYDKYCMSLYG